MTSTPQQNKNFLQNAIVIITALILFIGLIVFLIVDGESGTAKAKRKREEVKSQRHTVEGRIENIYHGDWNQLMIRFKNGRLLRVRHGLGYGEMINIPFHTDVVVTYDGTGKLVEVTKVADMEKWPNKIKLE